MEKVFYTHDPRVNSVFKVLDKNGKIINDINQQVLLKEHWILLKEYEFTITDKGELKASSKINKLNYDENIILLRLANNISNQIDRKITTFLNDL